MKEWKEMSNVYPDFSWGIRISIQAMPEAAVFRGDDLGTRASLASSYYIVSFWRKQNTQWFFFIIYALY